MTNHTITVVKDFHPQPYGRTPEDGPGCEDTAGSVFRDKILAPALHQYEHVTVDLTGYNRYGRSFLDEAFAGLIRESGFSYEELQKKLTYKHALVSSIITIIDERMQAARDSKLNG